VVGAWCSGCQDVRIPQALVWELDIGRAHERAVVSAVGESGQAGVFATLVLAFAADPVERWLYPEPQQYLSHFPKFLAAFGGRAFAERTVWSLGEFSAVALWLPPGTAADGEAITTSLAETVAADKHDDMFDVLGQMDAAIRPIGTGICHGSLLTPPCRAEGWVAS
jgi:hypothetical protein